MVVGAEKVLLGYACILVYYLYLPVTSTSRLNMAQVANGLEKRTPGYEQDMKVGRVHSA